MDADPAMEAVMKEIAKKHIKFSEDYIPGMYLDSERYPTFGWGHCFTNVRQFEDIKDYGDYLFEQDFNRAYGDYLRIMRNFNLGHLSYPRKMVILDMCYNMNYAKLSKFVNTLKALSEGRYLDAVEHMKNSKWYTQTGLRAKRMCNVIASNTYPIVPNRTASGVLI